MTEEKATKDIHSLCCIGYITKDKIITPIVQ